MSLHAVEIVCSPQQEDHPNNVPRPEPPELPNVVPERVEQNVKSKFEAVSDGQESPMSKAGGREFDNRPEHVRGRYRFSDAEDKAAVLDALERDVVADAKWYEIRFHVCDHDGEETIGSGCGYIDENGDKIFGWKTERSKGSVPDEV
jgi:hypothetical protein